MNKTTKTNAATLILMLSGVFYVLFAGLNADFNIFAWDKLDIAACGSLSVLVSCLVYKVIADAEKYAIEDLQSFADEAIKKMEVIEPWDISEWIKNENNINLKN